MDLNVLMRIKLGQVKLAPVTANGRSPLIVQTESMFALEAFEVYGSSNGAQQNTGMKRYRMWPMVLRLRTAFDEKRRARKALQAQIKRTR